MKRILIIAVLLSAMFCAPMSAVNYCASSSWGYAGTNVTGGGSASPTLVTSVNELKSAIGGKTPKNKVVIITTSLTFTSMLTMQDASNITIMALPGVILKSDQQDDTNSGILSIKRSSNIIIRNITFEGPGAYDIDGNDNLCFEDVTNAWVDHCDFQDGMDGNFDIKSLSDNITVSWCRFRYLKAPRARECDLTDPECKKLTDDHRFSNLIGSSSSQKPADGTYNITYAFCWWDQGCKQRMTRCRNCELHFLNCYWNSSVADYYVGPENAKCYFEGCTFAGKANSAKGIWNPFNGTTNYCTFVNCTGNLPANSSTPVAAPTYDYEILTAATAKNMITNSSCGAGATLTVTTAAEVSSSCDSDEPEPEPVISDWWNISDDDFKDLGSITSETTVRGLHIMAASDKAVIIDASAQTVDNIQFTHRLKFGGTGNANYRHVWFDVTGNCTITVYLTSSSGQGDARTLNIASGSFNHVVSTMSAPVASINTATYSYTGAATRIYLYSANSGINIYGIRIAYPVPTDIESVQNSEFRCQKIIREGRLLILRDNKTYDVLGLSL